MVNQSLTVFCVILASIFKIGSSLECYSCNTTYVTPRSDSACKGLEQVNKCSDPAVCLSAVLEEDDGVMKKYQEIKSCNLNQAGKECEYFLKNMQQMKPGMKISINTCLTCNKDKCNNSMASQAFIPSLLVFIVSFIICKLI